MSVLGLTWAFLDGPWDYPSLLERGREAAGGRPRWLPSVCKRVLEQFPERPADAHELELHLRGDPRAAAMDALVRIAKWHFPAPQMVPVHGVLAEFRVPWIETEGALAAFLGITPSELDWFADARRYNTARSDTALRHYHYRWVKKRTSGYRLFETPKPRLNFQHGMRASRRVRRAPSVAAQRREVRA